MEKTRQVFLLKAVLVIYYAVGLLGLSLPVCREIFSNLVPFSLILSAAVLLYFHTQWTRSAILVFFLVYLAGYLVEMAGVLTGSIFGDYLYGPALGPALFGTPLLIGLNWFILTYCAYHIFKDRRSIWVQALLGALLMVMFDFMLEPVATHLYWWLWVYGAIPLQNFIAWFIISYLMLLLLHQARMADKNPIAQFLFIVQFLFFLALNITL
jgi:putative membrane protein